MSGPGTGAAARPADIDRLFAALTFAAQRMPISGARGPRRNPTSII